MLLISIYSYGQEYTESTIILTNDDTLVGLSRIAIDNNITTLHYRDAITNKDFIYNPIDIRKILYPNGEVYESNSFLEGGIVFNDFFRCIVQGEVTLYLRYDSGLKEHLYLKINNEPLKELIVKKEIVYDQNRKTQNPEEKTTALYYRVLGYAYFKCPKLLDKNNIIALNEKSITKSVIDFHKCTNKPYTTYFAKEEQKSNPILIGFYYGRSFGSKEYFGNDIGWSNRIESSVFNGGYNIGCFISYFLPSSKQSKSVQLELVYSDFSYKTWETFEFVNTSGDRIAFSKQYIQLKGAIKHHIWMKNHGFFIGLGAQFISMTEDRNYHYVKPRTYGYPVIGYLYNFSKIKVFADFRYDVFFDKNYTANFGFIFNSKKTTK